MNYRVFQNGQEVGPHTWPELQEMLARGTFAMTDRVREETGADWTTIEALANSMSKEAPMAAPLAPAFASIPAYAMPGSEMSFGHLAPSYRLFDSRAVGLATFFGSPLAGAIVMALNYRRLGKSSSAGAAVGAGVLGTALALGLSFLLPQGFSGGVGLALLLVMMNLAKAKQGPAVEEHLRQGGKLASRWTAFFIAIGILAVIVGVAVAGVIGYTLVAKPGAP